MDETQSGFRSTLYIECPCGHSGVLNYVPSNKDHYASPSLSGRLTFDVNTKAVLGKGATIWGWGEGVQTHTPSISKVCFGKGKIVWTPWYMKLNPPSWENVCIFRRRSGNVLGAFPHQTCQWSPSPSGSAYDLLNWLYFCKNGYFKKIREQVHTNIRQTFSLSIIPQEIKHEIYANFQCLRFSAFNFTQ